MRNILSYHQPVLDNTLENLNHLQSLKLLLLLNLTETQYYRQIIINKYQIAINIITLYYYRCYIISFPIGNLARESVELILLSNYYKSSSILSVLHKKINDVVPFNLKTQFIVKIAELMDTHSNNHF